MHPPGLLRRPGRGGPEPKQRSILLSVRSGLQEVVDCASPAATHAAQLNRILVLSEHQAAAVRPGLWEANRSARRFCRFVHVLKSISATTRSFARRAASAASKIAASIAERHPLPADLRSFMVALHGLCGTATRAAVPQLEDRTGFTKTSSRSSSTGVFTAK